MGIRKCPWSSSPPAGIIDPAGIMNGSDGECTDDHDEDHVGDDGSEMGVFLTKLLQTFKSCVFLQISQ